MSPTRIVADGQELMIDAMPLTALVHPNGMRVDVPEAVEVNCRTTIDVMSKMSQRAWVHISTGELFQHLFRKVFPEEDGVKIPEAIEELNGGDFGVIHVSGMIVQCCEAMFEGKKKIFLRNPENYLHPKAEQKLMSMIQEMQSLLGGSGVQVMEHPPDETPNT